MSELRSSAAGCQRDIAAMTSLPAGLTGRREKLMAICAVFIGLAAGYPSSYAATATTFILPLTAEFGWGRTIPSLMYVSSMLGLAISSVWLGRIIERVGAAAAAAVSGISLALVNRRTRDELPGCLPRDRRTAIASATRTRDGTACVMSSQSTNNSARECGLAARQWIAAYGHVLNTTPARGTGAIR